MYIKEAHAEDRWVSALNRAERIRVPEPTSNGERIAVARHCRLKLAMSIPVLVDSIDNRAARAYGAWPDRLYLIGRDGSIVYQGDPGPGGFQPEALEAAIERELSKQSGPSVRDHHR